MTEQPTAGSIPEWTLGDRLRKAREHARLSQQELAEVMGIARRSVSNYEADTYVPKRPVLLTWSFATGVPLAWLETGAAGPGGSGGEEAPAAGLEPATYRLTPRLEHPYAVGRFRRLSLVA